MSREIEAMENSVQSWYRRFAFVDYLITRSALASTLGEIVRPICLAVLKINDGEDALGDR